MWEFLAFDDSGEFVVDSGVEGGGKEWVEAIILHGIEGFGQSHTI